MAVYLNRFSHRSRGRRQRSPAIRDLVIISLVATIGFVLANAFDLNERFVAWALRLQADTDIELEELPIAVSLTALGLAWCTWRRWRDYLTEAGVHAATAGRLAAAAAEAEAARAELERVNRRLRDAIETIPGGFVLFDSDDRYVLWNRRYEQIYPDLALYLGVGRRFEDALRDVLRPGHYLYTMGLGEAWLAERMAVHRAMSGTHEQLLSDGRWVRVEERRTSEGDSIGIRIDITEHKQREQQLGDALKRAEAANTAKTAFLANMSHELRTPLNAIIGFSEIIAGGIFGPVGPPCYQVYAADILAAGRHLLGVVNDVLDLAQVEAGHLEFDPSRVDVTAVARESIRLMTTAAAAADVRLAVVAEPGAPDVTADPMRLRQVLLNLLSNSVKFTPAGGCVTIRVGTDDVHPGWALITVADTGIGIAADQIDKVMTPFGRVDSPLAARQGGTGLGLPLARRYVEGMGGRFRLDSSPGRGTVVSLSLPSAAAAAQPAFGGRP